MGVSTFISAALHVAVLFLVIVGFPTSRMTPAPLVAIPVDLATVSDTTKVKAGTRDAETDAPLAGKPQAPKPKAVKEKTAPKPEKQAAKKAEAPKPQAKPAAPSPKLKAQASDKQASDSDKIAALLNKIPDAKDEPEPQALAEETTPVRGQTTGSEMTMSINELDALRARIADCWTPPPGGLGADAIVVKLRLKLNEDGTLEGTPTVTNRGASPFFQAAADSAVRAVFQCQPYALPVAKYALWRDMILNFDPSQMYRSG
jgi:hypothetical protein